MPLKKNIGSSPQKPVKELGLENVRIISHSFNTWVVELFLKLDEISEENLSKKLQQVKQAIVEKYDLPAYSLRYQELLQKEVTSEGVSTRVRLEKILLDKGRPKFTFRSAVSPQGIPYNEMVCYGELFMLDEFEKQLTAERLLNYLHLEGVMQDFIDPEAISAAISELISKRAPIQGVKLAQGIFPDAGKDAEVEFYFAAAPSTDNLDEYVSSRKASRGDLMCVISAPTDGKTEGMTVKGRRIPPGKGLNITLEAGKNVRADSNGTRLSAEADGLVVIRREERSFMTPAGEKIIPSKIIVRVDPLMVIESDDDTVNITTRESVEVRGKLKMGSHVVSSGEVHIEGDVGENSSIIASDDIVINGSTKNVNLSSNRNIIAKQGISGGVVTASENVFASSISNATVSGKKIVSDKIEGGQIFAGDEVTVNELGADTEGISATIFVGMRDFLETKIKENSDFIADAKKNLSKLIQLFGEEIVNEVFPQNVQQMMLKFTTIQKKKEGLKTIPQHKLDTFKRLLNSIEPLRRLANDREVENIKLRRQIRSTGKEQKIMVVKERITAKTRVVVDGKTHTVEPREGKFDLSDIDKRIRS